MDFKKEIAKIINFENKNIELIEKMLQKVQDSSKGDYALPCFAFAKQLKTNPIAFAEELANNINSQTNKNNLIQKAEAVRGYLNIFLNKELITKQIIEDSKKPSFLKFNKANNKKVIFDYSSVNIAKQMHIGHLSNTVIGEAISKMHEALGYEMVRINYLGNFGTPYGKIIAAYKLWGDEKRLEKEGVDYLQNLYIRICKEEETNEEYAEMGRRYFKLIEDENEEVLKLFNKIKEITLNEVKPIFETLNITFDDWRGELYYAKQIKRPLNLLKEKDLLVKSDGATIVDLSEENLGACMVQKSNGGSTYALRDLSAAIGRYEEYKYDKALYLTGTEQKLHFKQFITVLKKADQKWADNIVHLCNGLVSLSDTGKISSRKGTQGLLKDMLNAAIETAGEIIEEKNPNIKNKNEVAKRVGVGALVVRALQTTREKSDVFDLKEALSFEGETGPYMQYTYVRCASVLRKLKAEKGCNNSPKCGGIEADYSCLNSNEVFDIIKEVNNMQETIEYALSKYEPIVLTRMLMDLCKTFNKFYHENRIITDNIKQTKARAEFITVFMKTLKRGLNILGVQTVEEM